MKRLMFAILALPLLAGCWGTENKKAEVVESAPVESNLEQTEKLIGTEEEISDNMALPTSNDK